MKKNSYKLIEFNKKRGLLLKNNKLQFVAARRSIKNQ